MLQEKAGEIEASSRVGSMLAATLNAFATSSNVRPELPQPRRIGMHTTLDFAYR